MVIAGPAAGAHLAPNRGARHHSATWTTYTASVKRPLIVGEFRFTQLAETAL